MFKNMFFISIFFSFFNTYGYTKTDVTLLKDYATKPKQTYLTVKKSLPGKKSSAYNNSKFNTFMLTLPGGDYAGHDFKREIKPYLPPQQTGSIAQELQPHTINPHNNITKPEGLNLAEAALQDSNFRGANLTGISFANSNLSGSDFTNAILHNTSFTNAILENTKFNGAKSEYTDFVGAFIFGADFSKSEIHNADFSSASNCKYKGHILGKNNNNSKTLQHECYANFEGADLGGKAVTRLNEYTYKELRHDTIQQNFTRFNNAIMPNANFTNSNLTNAMFFMTDLRNANFANSKTDGAIFPMAQVCDIQGSTTMSDLSGFKKENINPKMKLGYWNSDPIGCDGQPVVNAQIDAFKAQTGKRQLQNTNEYQPAK